MRRARRLWLRLHRWLGLALGAIGALIGLTGSAIVFDHAIDAWLNPRLLTAQGAGPPRPLGEIVSAASAAVGGRVAGLSVTMPGVDHDVFTVHFDGGPAGPAGRSVEVAVDPATATVLGQRRTGSHFTAVVYELHHTLLLRDAFGIPDIGMHAVGVIGLGFMVSTLTGLYLWWPRWRHVGQALRIAWRRGARRATFDLHRAVGVWTALVVLTLAFSGVYLVFPGWVRPLVAVAAPTEPRPAALRSVPTAGATPLSVDAAAEIAIARVPGARLSWLRTPRDAADTYQAWLRRPGDVRRTYGDAIVWIDQWSGAVLLVRDRRTMPRGEAFLHWQFPLHSGEAFGLLGRLTVFTAGLTPLLLFVTGSLIWWRKRRARRVRGRPALRPGGPPLDPPG